MPFDITPIATSSPIVSRPGTPSSTPQLMSDNGPLLVPVELANTVSDSKHHLNLNVHWSQHQHLHCPIEVQDVPSDYLKDVNIKFYVLPPSFQVLRFWVFFRGDYGFYLGLQTIECMVFLFSLSANSKRLICVLLAWLRANTAPTAQPDCS